MITVERMKEILDECYEKGEGDYDFFYFLLKKYLDEV